MFFTVLTERQEDSVHGILIDLQSKNSWDMSDSTVLVSITAKCKISTMHHHWH